MLAGDGSIGGEGAIGKPIDNAVGAGPDHGLFIPGAGNHVPEGGAAAGSGLSGQTVEDRDHHGPAGAAVGIEAVGADALHQAVAHRVIDPFVIPKRGIHILEGSGGALGTAVTALVGTGRGGLCGNRGAQGQGNGLLRAGLGAAVLQGLHGNAAAHGALGNVIVEGDRADGTVDGILGGVGEEETAAAVVIAAEEDLRPGDRGDREDIRVIEDLDETIGGILRCERQGNGRTRFGRVGGCAADGVEAAGEGVLRLLDLGSCSDCP